MKKPDLSKARTKDNTVTGHTAYYVPVSLSKLRLENVFQRVVFLKIFFQTDLNVERQRGIFARCLSIEKFVLFKIYSRLLGQYGRHQRKQILESAKRPIINRNWLYNSKKWVSK